MTYSDRTKLMSTEHLWAFAEDSLAHGYWGRVVAELDELATRPDIPKPLRLSLPTPRVVSDRVELVNAKWEEQNS